MSFAKGSIIKLIGSEELSTVVESKPSSVKSATKLGGFYWHSLSNVVSLAAKDWPTCEKCDEKKRQVTNPENLLGLVCLGCGNTSHKPGCPFGKNVPKSNLKSYKERFDLDRYLINQRTFSKKTFGPLDRGPEGVIDHLKKELVEVEESPEDIFEWVDVVILAFDGMFRTGHTVEEILLALQSKQETNFGRKWPNWEDSEPGKAIEHCDDGEEDKITTNIDEDE